MFFVYISKKYIKMTQREAVTCKVPTDGLGVPNVSLVADSGTTPGSIIVSTAKYLSSSTEQTFRRFYTWEVSCVNSIRYRWANLALATGLAGTLRVYNRSTGEEVFTRASTANTDIVQIADIDAGNGLIFVYEVTASVYNANTILGRIYTQKIPSAGATTFTDVTVQSVTSGTSAVIQYYNNTVVNGTNKYFTITFTDATFSAMTDYLLGAINQVATAAAFTQITISKASPIFGNQTVFRQSFAIGDTIQYFLQASRTGSFTGTIECKTVQQSGGGGGGGAPVDVQPLVYTI